VRRIRENNDHGWGRDIKKDAALVLWFVTKAFAKEQAPLLVTMALLHRAPLIPQWHRFYALRWGFSLRGVFPWEGSVTWMILQGHPYSCSEMGPRR